MFKISIILFKFINLTSKKKIETFYLTITKTDVMLNSTFSFSIYNASAGSGKTYTLSKEYIKLLFLAPQDDAYKKILAITFTNKAVEEMKNRIVGSLYGFSLDATKTSEKNTAFLAEIAKEIEKPIADLKLKSKRIIKNIIHNYAAFDILTIDKFTHKVIRTFAQDLKLPSQFDIALDTDLLLQEAVDTVINQAGTDAEITKLLIDYSNQKADDDKNWDVTRELFEASRLLTKETHAKEIETIQEKSINDFEVFKGFLENKTAQKKQEAKEVAASVLLLLKDKGVDNASFSRKTYPNFLLKVLNDDCDITNPRHLEEDDIKVNKTAKDKDIIAALVPDLILKNKEIYALYGEIQFYEAIEKNINPLTLLQKIREAFVHLQEDQQLVSIADFNKLIHEQIKNQPAPFIYERLGEKYRHFFIDEFQDTSEMQWNNLIPLIENSLSSMENNIKGTLMIVGDPKQSIYRWRGGKAEQFIALADKTQKGPFPMVDKETVWLEKNYRSFDEVIDFNNSFFAFMSGYFNNASYKQLYETESFQKTTNKPGGYVSITLLADETEEQTTFDDDALNEVQKAYILKTHQKIEELIALGYNKSDIAILTRKNKEGYWLAEYLTKQGVPILTSESLLLENATEIKTIIAWLQFIENNKNQEAKTDLLYYLAEELKVEDKHLFITSGMEFVKLDFEQFLLTKGFEFSFNDCRKKSLYETIEYLISKFCVSKKDTAYTQYFLDIVLEKTIKAQASISDFLYYWDTVGFKKSIPSPEGVDAIRIMSIHKSKGLEFPVVILPFMEADLYRIQSDPVWLDFPEENTFDRVMVNKTKKVAFFNSQAQSVYEEKEQEELLDLVNVLYVAMTRPVEQLHIITRVINTSKGLANNLSSYFINYLQLKQNFQFSEMQFEKGVFQLTSEPETLNETTFTIKSVNEKLKWSKIKIAQRESLMWGTKQESAIAFGNNIHEVLSKIKTFDDIETAVNTAEQEGVLPTTHKSEIVGLLNKIINHPELSLYFTEEYKVYNEQVVLQNNKQNAIPDRIMIKGNEAIIIDYKTGDVLPKHQQQINLYASLLEEMGYTVAKKILVYIQDEINIIHL